MGSWGNAKRLISHLEALGLVPMQFENVARALCKTIRKQVEPMAKALLPNGIHGPSILDEEVGHFCPQAISVSDMMHIPNLCPIIIRMVRALGSLSQKIQSCLAGVIVT